MLKRMHGYACVYNVILAGIEDRRRVSRFCANRKDRVRCVARPRPDTPICVRNDLFADRSTRFALLRFARFTRGLRHARLNGATTCAARVNKEHARLSNVRRKTKSTNTHTHTRV